MARQSHREAEHPSRKPNQGPAGAGSKQPTDTERGASLSHVDADGAARMVDVSNKDVTAREAAASAVVRTKREVLDAMMAGTLPKGDALATARVAGIMTAKRTAEWIPLCHPLPLDEVRVEFTRTGDNELRIVCTAKAIARTGVEMEALTGAAATALCLYDMAKAADRSITIGPIQLETKSGGRRGDYRRADVNPADS